MILDCVIGAQSQAWGRFDEWFSDKQFGDDIGFSCGCGVCYGLFWC